MTPPTPVLSKLPVDAEPEPSPPVSGATTPFRSTSSCPALARSRSGTEKLQVARSKDGKSSFQGRNTTPTTALPSSQSPCFYHNRFDDAVNIDKALEEIKNDDCMSHFRLVQTTTGVQDIKKREKEPGEDVQGLMDLHERA
ncbi:hypothetical protein CkaCkLH20_12605 [Colletotrichum karsti]|uniref:Uncharacterized protein n=1 Tax=Colletotrichum karsti TaxID=1095194 RepID=A0A9P6HSU6_9PEZI|nr:uncharacterized protein CkaCkLH20_12605 [Colletotrichum karsti]KAF9869898.1 hypothetical protein CkaCkLH20_12605 [Colletotrichum karsti]